MYNPTPIHKISFNEHLLPSLTFLLFVLLIIVFKTTNFSYYLWRSAKWVIRILSAILSRLIYSTHAGFALWRVQQIVDNSVCLFILYMIFALQPLEAFYNLKHRQGKEYKWWSPVTFVYLLSVVSSLLVLEVYNHEIKGALQNQINGYASDHMHAYHGESGHPHFDEPLNKFIGLFLRSSQRKYDQFITSEMDNTDYNGRHYSLLNRDPHHSYNGSKMEKFYQDYCQNEKLPEEFCTCLTEQSYHIFFVNFGLRVF